MLKSKGSGACIVCGGTSGNIVYEENEFSGVLCECGAIFISPVPSRAQTDPRLDLHLESYYSLPARVRLDWVEKHANGRRYLDIGAGNGATVEEALSRGFTVSAIDPNPACVDHLVSNYPVAVEQSTIESSRLPAQSYDINFHVDLLSHFENPVAALRKMAGLVDQNSGVVCFEVGLFGGLNEKWYPWAGRPGFPHHRWFFSEENIKTLLCKAGLEVIEVKYFNVAPSTILSTILSRLLPDRIKFTAGSSSLQAAKANFVWSSYHYAHYLLRYKIGRWLPRFGPGSVLVAARPRAVASDSV